MHSHAPPDPISAAKSSDAAPFTLPTEGRVSPGTLDACLFLSLILVGVICIFLVWETRAWTRVAAEQAELSVVETVASDLRRSLESLDVSIMETSKSLQMPGVWELSPELRQTVLFASSTQAKGVSAIYVIAADGSLRSMAGDQAPPAVNFKDRAYFEFHRTHPDTAVQISDPIKGRLDGNSVIVLSKRINDSKGNFAGVVAGSVQLSFVDDLFRKVDRRNGAVLILVNTNGRMVARLPAEAHIATAALSQTAISEHAAHAISGTYSGISTIDGQPRLVAYREITGFPFVVAYAQLTQEIFADWVNGSLIIAAALVVLSTVGILVMRELRRERARRANAEMYIRRSVDDLSIANAELQQRIGKEVQSRKDTQEKLAKSQRLEALGQLAGGIAHDINNVLQTVTGACSLVQTHEAENDEVRRLTTIAISAADRGSAVTQRLLLFARRAAIKPGSVNTAVVLDDLRELLSHTSGDNIVLKLDMADNVPNLIADRMQLETVIINLATNARDAMPDGGTITIAAQAEMIGEDETEAEGLVPRRYVRLSVTDTGMGMDENILARATEPFFSTKGVGQGTGLGLSMAKGFAEQSGGKFRIVSGVGEGTTVSLWFPAGERSRVRDPIQPQAPARARQSGSKVQVLVVDDNIEANELIGEWLVASAFEVHQANSGEEALSKVKAGLGIDLLLTDLSMPGMDGLQLIREIRTIIADVPAILLTGNTSAVAGLTIEDAAGDNCLVLQKPVRMTELVRHIELMLCGGTALLDPARLAATLDVI